MSASAPALSHSPLEPVLVRAGATMVARHGWLVAAHFGSPAGEIALCESAVGLADRSDLGKLELRGDPGALELVVGQLAGAHVLPGEALLTAGAWWCSLSPGHVLSLCDAGSTPRLGAALEAATRWAPGAALRDRSAELAAVGLLGPGTAALLEDLSDAQPPLEEVAAPAFDATRLAGVPVLLLRASPKRAVALVEARRAGELWMNVERAGRAAGLGFAGADAVSHLSPLGR